MADLRGFLERTFADRGGAMPFDEFMALALYDAEHGYYTRRIADVGGRGGDFATAATLSAGLGRAVAGWVLAEIAHHGWRGPVHLIEIGGGNGELAASVLGALGWWRRCSVRYHLVEVSPVLRERQRVRLGRAVRSWHASPAEALAACGGRALVFSNELVDAFPAKRLAFADGEWREVWVRFDAGGVREEFRGLPDALTVDTFSALGLADPLPGQRIEIHASYRDWLRDWAPRWKEGSILTIDYGAETADGAYSRRPGGTMRGYFKHERIEGADLYSRFGKQDLTCDVNFADPAAWGGALGWETRFLESQARFFERFGVGNDAMGSGGPGESFFALSQRLVTRDS
jgi:SAM-dependent MidA family methyltransferase